MPASSKTRPRFRQLRLAEGRAEEAEHTGREICPEELARDGRDEDLSAVANGQEAGTSIEWRSEVVAIPFVSLASVHRHANAERGNLAPLLRGKLKLYLDGC